MNSFFKFSFLIFLAHSFVQCAGKKNDRTEIEIIDLVGAYKQQKQSSAGISLFSDSEIEYIQLKTPKEINIHEDYLRVYADMEHIILIGFKQMFLFDRNNGKFIHEISRLGRGPNEYGSTSLNAYDYSRKVIIAYQWDTKKYFEYNVKGEVIANLNFACPEDRDLSSQANHLKDSIYVVYYSNQIDENQQRLRLIDTQCNILKTYYHAFKIENEPRAFATGLSTFYKYQGNLIFFEEYCDTLFHITKKRLIPRFVFDMGEFAPPYEKQFDLNYLRGEGRKNDFHINKLFESTRYLFIRFSYNGYWFWQAVYEKTEKIVLMQGDDQGFDNDIDNFVPLKHATSINNENELIGFIEAYNVVDWFKTHPEKAAKLPAQLKKYKNMNQSDSPLVMIMKVKQ